MFLAAKVGITAFKVGKIAANTNSVFGSLLEEIELWKVYSLFLSSPLFPLVLYI